MKKLLIVDDNAELRADLAEVLTGAGYVTDEASSALEAVEKVSGGEISLVLLDFMMPRLGGIDALIEIKKRSPHAKIVIITAFPSIENAIQAIKHGASEYMTKPFKIEDLLNIIARVLEEARFEEGIKNLAMDETLGALANPIRRKILKMLCERSGMRLMEISRELKIGDHTKAVFHLKILTEAGIVVQNGKKTYVLTSEGQKVVEGLKFLQMYLCPDALRTVQSG